VNTLPTPSLDNDSKVSAYTSVDATPANSTATLAAPVPPDPASFDTVPVDSASGTPMVAALTPINGPVAIPTNPTLSSDRVLVFNPAVIETPAEAPLPSPARPFTVTSNISSNSSPTTTVARPIVNVNSAPPSANLAPIADPIAKTPEAEATAAHTLPSNLINSAADNAATNNLTNRTTNNVSNSTQSLTSDLTPSSRTPNSDASAPTATTNEEPAKAAASAQSFTAAASQPSAVDKKPAALEINATLPPGGSPALLSTSASTAQIAAAALPPSVNPSPAITTPAPPAPPSPTPVNSGPAPALPQTHQMLDSAPPAAIASDPTALPGDVHADAQTAAQMHLGMRTDAFGAVEIHTVVQQSQIGITVHSDRDISRWFSSELPGLESGLNNSHLNLTAVNFDHGRSGVQAETGFQQGQPRQQYSQTPSSPFAPPSGFSLAEPETTEFAAPDILPTDLSAGPAQIRVSILA
jgi:hypothetical protein